MTEQVERALNPSDEHPPSRPGTKTVLAAIALAAGFAAIFNWPKVQGLLGAS